MFTDYFSDYITVVTKLVVLAVKELADFISTNFLS